MVSAMSKERSLKRKAALQDPEEERSSESHVGGEKPLSAQDRMAQFRALKMRAKDSKKENRHALYQEHARMKVDPRAQHKLELSKSIASEKLAKLDAAESGSDFERKRAWDYSIAESEAWDARVKQKRENADLAGYSDYATEAAAQYERNTKGLKPNLERYKEQQEALSKALGGTNGTMIAADGTTIQTSHTTDAELNHIGFIHQKADKEGIDRLMADLNKSDAARLKAQIKRGRGEGDEGDYISDQNKIFNAKVARFYDKYTKEMKDSFERGTAQ